MRVSSDHPHGGPIPQQRNSAQEPTPEVPLGEAGRLLASHGSPTGLRDVLTPTTPPEPLSAALGET